MAKAILTLRVDPEIKEKLEELARSTARSKSFIASEAIRNIIDLNEWQVRAIKQGVDATEQGRIVEHDRVARWVESWGSQDELERPKCE